MEYSKTIQLLPLVLCSLNFINQETPAVVTARVLIKRLLKAFKIWHRPTLPRVTAVPSALVGLTSLFGMGRGGHHRYRHLNVFK